MEFTEYKSNWGRLELIDLGITVHNIYAAFSEKRYATAMEVLIEEQMKANRGHNILTGDLNYLAHKLNNDYPITRVADGITSNMDYIFSPVLHTIKSKALASISDHFCLIRLYDVTRVQRSEIRVSR